MKKEIHAQFYFGIGLGFVNQDGITVIVLPFFIIFFE